MYLLPNIRKDFVLFCFQRSARNDLEVSEIPFED